MPRVGLGVREIRIHADEEFGVMYVAKFAEAVYVLHAFEKKRSKQRSAKSTWQSPDSGSWLRNGGENADERTTEGGAWKWKCIQ